MTRTIATRCPVGGAGAGALTNRTSVSNSKCGAVLGSDADRVCGRGIAFTFDAVRTRVGTRVDSALPAAIDSAHGAGGDPAEGIGELTSTAVDATLLARLFLLFAVCSAQNALSCNAAVPCIAALSVGTRMACATVCAPL